MRVVSFFVPVLVMPLLAACSTEMCATGSGEDACVQRFPAIRQATPMRGSHGGSNQAAKFLRHTAATERPRITLSTPSPETS